MKRTPSAPPHVVVDTSALVCLLRVPKLGTELDYSNAGVRLRAWQAAKAKLYLTAPVVIETGNHIAQARSPDRHTLATGLQRLVSATRSTTSGFLWAHAPGTLEDWERVLADFPRLAAAGIGAADAALIDLVSTLRARHARAPVHIWTLDEALVHHGDPFTP